MSKRSACSAAKQMWERACSRKRCVSRHLYRLTRPLREQARSHRGFVLGLGMGLSVPQQFTQRHAVLEHGGFDDDVAEVLGDADVLVQQAFNHFLIMRSEEHTSE